MNLNEPFRNVQNTSEDFRSVLNSSEEFSDPHNTSKRAGGVGRGKKYDGAETPDHNIGHDFLIMEEAYALFESQGERRSLRMIGEYCKTGELVCTYDSDDKRWHITRESIHGKLEKIKALNARRKPAAQPQSTLETFTEPPAAPQRPVEESRSDREATPPRTAEAVPPQSESDPSQTEEIKKLEQKVMDLTIMNAGKDILIKELREDRKDLINRIENSGRLIGRLKTQLLGLMPGKRPQGNEVDSSAPKTSINPPVANESTDALLDNDDDDYENPPQESFAAA